MATQGRRLSRADLTPVREGLVLSPLSREGSSLAIEVRTDSPSLPSRGSPRVSNRSNASSLTPSQEVALIPDLTKQHTSQHLASFLLQAAYDAQAIVDHHYEATYRHVDQQLEGAQQLVAQRARSPQRPYPIRPKNRVSTDFIILIQISLQQPSIIIFTFQTKLKNSQYSPDLNY